MFHLIVEVLTAFVVLELWFEGSIFARPRAGLEAWAADANRAFRFVGELFTCRLCLGTWVCLFVSLPSPLEGEDWFLSWGAVRGGEYVLAQLLKRILHVHQNDIAN